MRCQEIICRVEIFKSGVLDGCLAAHLAMAESTLRSATPNSKNPHNKQVKKGCSGMSDSL